MSLARRVVLGRVARPHGLRGEVLVREASLAADEWPRLERVYLMGPGALPERPARVVSARAFGSGLLVLFSGVESAEAASALRGASVEADRAALPEPRSEEMYVYDLIGLTVVDETGREIGVVQDVISTGAHEILEIAPAGPPGGVDPLLIPYRPEFVLGWEPEARRLRVRVPAGLEDIYRS
jgi:16S rRNA processing protein RimM